MANVLSFKDLQKVNRDFEKPVIDSTNAGISPFNLLLGRYINVPTTFSGVVIGDFIVAQENGVYIGPNLRITQDGIVRKAVVVDAGQDIRFDLTRTNPIDIMDGVDSSETESPLPINPLYNWGRPIADAGVAENITR